MSIACPKCGYPAYKTLVYSSSGVPQYWKYRCVWTGCKNITKPYYLETEAKIAKHDRALSHKKTNNRLIENCMEVE